MAETEIGRLGLVMENAHGLAMNGTEVVHRASYPHPRTGNDFFEIQNSARALDNFCIGAPNLARGHTVLCGMASTAAAAIPAVAAAGRRRVIDDWVALVEDGRSDTVNTSTDITRPAVLARSRPRSAPGHGFRGNVAATDLTAGVRALPGAGDVIVRPPQP